MPKKSTNSAINPPVDRRSAHTDGIATAMTALSHPRRVRILFALLSAGREGLTFENLLAATKLNVSTLSHHLKPMEAAALVVRRRRGVNVFIRLRAPRGSNPFADVAELLAGPRSEAGPRPRHPGAFIAPKVQSDAASL